MAFELSYIISTYNRLPFLKITLSKLIEGLKENEEIVVVDGGSTDETQAYLQDLFSQGIIHQYISEPDRNQAHGWNKAMLMAKGSLIKKIIDDDVFDFESIRKCAQFMRIHPDTDVIISNDLSSKLSKPTEITKNTRLAQYENWARQKVSSFTFGDVHILIRKSAIALIGLYNIGYIMIDWEYSLRISYLRANIVYYTGYNALSVFHEQSVSGLKKTDEITAQGKKTAFFYDYAGDHAGITFWSKVKIAIGKKIFPERVASKEPNETSDLIEIYKYLYQEIERINNSEEFSFITTASFNETKN